jgi:hypothetical protein
MAEPHFKIGQQIRVPQYILNSCIAKIVGIEATNQINRFIPTSAKRLSDDSSFVYWLNTLNSEQGLSATEKELIEWQKF